MQRADYVGPMSENLDDAPTGSDAGPESDIRSKSPEGDLSTKLDPDVIPQQGDSPEVERTREHPEETGS